MGKPHLSSRKVGLYDPLGGLHGGFDLHLSFHSIAPLEGGVNRAKNVQCSKPIPMILARLASIVHRARDQILNCECSSRAILFVPNRGGAQQQRYGPGDMRRRHRDYAAKWNADPQMQTRLWGVIPAQVDFAALSESRVLRPKKIDLRPADRNPLQEAQTPRRQNCPLL